MSATNVTKYNLGRSVKPHNQQNPYIKLNKSISKQDSNIIFSNLNKDTKSKKSKGRNVKYIEKETKPIPSLEDWLRNDEENGGFMCENSDFGRRDEQDNE